MILAISSRIVICLRRTRIYVVEPSSLFAEMPTSSLTFSHWLAPCNYPSLTHNFHHFHMLPYQMRSTGIPELTCVEDTNYIRNVLEVDLAVTEHVAEMRFRKVIQKCLNLKWTVQIMWRLHIVKNGSRKCV